MLLTACVVFEPFIFINIKGSFHINGHLFINNNKLESLKIIRVREHHAGVNF